MSTYYYESGGVEIEESTQSGAGYRGVALIGSYGWDRPMVDALPFQAFLGRTNVPENLWDTIVSAKKSWCVQLGYYRDVRVAAQVAAWAEANPKKWINECQGNKAYDGELPEELYTIPVTMTASQAITTVRKNRGMIIPAVIDTARLVCSDRSRLKSVYGEDLFMALGKLYGRDMVMRDITNLYDDEFINRYGLDEEN